MKRYFEFVGEDSSRGFAQSAKFWEVWVEDSTLYTRFGKIGANGQTTMKDFPSPNEAVVALDKAVVAKVKKGYQESAASSPKDESGEDSFEEDAREKLFMLVNN